MRQARRALGPDRMRAAEERGAAMSLATAAGYALLLTAPAQLYISIRTVRSHLDRIRDKTGCRRHADLTRLALSEGKLRRRY